MQKNAKFFTSPKFIIKNKSSKVTRQNLQLDFFLNNFVQNELPILTMRRLRKIQALFRGVYFRQKILPKILKWRKAVLKFSEEFFIKTIEQKLLNEVIFESLQECKIQNTEKAVRYTEYLIDYTCMKMSREVVNQIVRYEVNKVLHNKSRKVLTDPMDIITHDIIYNLSQKESKKIVKESIDELSQEYILKNKLKQIIDKNIVQKSVENICKQIIHDILIEYIIEDMFNKLQEELVEPLSILTFNEERALQENSFFEEQFQEFTDRTLQEILTDMLLQSVSGSCVEKTIISVIIIKWIFE